MNNKSADSRTLGPASSKFIDELQRQGKSIFTLSDASKLYNKGHYETTKFLGDLVERGILARIKSGIYLILQAGKENTQLSNWPIIAREVAGEQYFISYYSALRFHGMTTHPLVTVYITMPERRRNKKIANITYHFIYSKPEHFWGGDNYWVTKQEQVCVSDIERTLLDGLDKPELCGGVKEVVRGIWILQKQIDWDKLVQYAVKYRTKAAIKRLGFILEMLDIARVSREELEKIVFSAKDYNLLDPNGIKIGRHLSRWHLQVNMNIEELKASVWE